MWFLIVDNEVVGQVDDQKQVYGAVLHYIRQRTSAAPYLVGDFAAIFNPVGCYFIKEQGVYTARMYTLERGLFYNCNIYDEFVIHVSEFNAQQRSSLKLSYLEAVKKEQLLKPVLVKSPNA